MPSDLHVIAVLPAYNAARTLERTVADIDPDVVHEVIVVDDASQDETVALARSLPQRFAWLAAPDAFTLHARERNGGYGANQKDCYRLALARGADIIVMVHADYQYDPTRVAALIAPLKGGEADTVLGTRIHASKEARAGGMPPARYVTNRVLSALQNAATGLSLSEWHSGMRAYARHALEATPFDSFSDSFYFDTQMLFALAERRFRIAETPIPVRYAADSSSISVPRGIAYSARTLARTARHLFHRARKGARK